ncbi:MAG: glycosyltransferase, partial [Lysinibacillus sp.]
MNILLINHYAGSQQHGMEFRPYYLAKEWVKKGHQVTIIGASYSHLRTQNIEINAGFMFEEQIEGIRYIWLKTSEYANNGLSRLKNTFEFSFLLYKHAKKLCNMIQPDVVLASSPHPFIFYGAKKIAKKGNCKIVFEVRDLWPLSMI